MAYKIYTKEDLANFAGRPAVSIPPFWEVAVAQATLLFKIATCLTNPPTDPTEAQLVDMAILSMADSILLAQPYREALASPFTSESIGSYSYGKTAKAVANGQSTGIMWFDMAVDRLGQCDLEQGIPMGGGIDVFGLGAYTPAGARNYTFLGPEDLNESRVWGYDPAPGYPGVPQYTAPSQGSSGDTWIEDPDNPGYLIEGN